MLGLVVRSLKNRFLFLDLTKAAPLRLRGLHFGVSKGAEILLANHH